MTPINANNNYCPLPWYGALDFQTHRKFGSGSTIFPIFAPTYNFPPFQIVRKTSSANTISGALYDYKGKKVRDITASDANRLGIIICAFPSFGYDVIVNTGNRIFWELQEGMYYAMLTDGESTWYSEVFTVVADLSGYLKIEWYDEQDLILAQGRVVYNNSAVGEQYKHRIYLCSELGRPDYNFEEEGESRDGFFFPEKQLSEKTYKFTFFAPEPICDALRLVRLSDHKSVTASGILYNCDTFLISVKWLENGEYATVEAEFETQTVAKKIPKGYYAVEQLYHPGSFNEDYDNDFDK